MPSASRRALAGARLAAYGLDPSAFQSGWLGMASAQSAEARQRAKKGIELRMSQRRAIFKQLELPLE